MKKWQESRKRWRDKHQVEEFDMEECGEKVYSPQRGSTEGEEKEKRREIIRRARRL